MGRLSGIASLPGGVAPEPTPVRLLTLGIIGAGLVLVAWAAWRVPAARVFVVLAGVQLAFLLAAPPFFTYYADFLTVALALVVAAFVHTAATAPGGRSLVRTAVAAVPVLAVAIQSVVLVLSPETRVVAPFPQQAQMAAAAAPLRCVMSDSPSALIQTDTLSRSFADGCQNWVDVLAPTYGAGNPADRVIPGTRNPVWAADLYGYLSSGDGVILMNATSSRYLTRRDEAALRSGPVLFSSGTYTLNAVTP